MMDNLIYKKLVWATMLGDDSEEGGQSFVNIFHGGMGSNEPISLTPVGERSVEGQREKSSCPQNLDIEAGGIL